jgi:hypothetical protein
MKMRDAIRLVRTDKQNNAYASAEDVIRALKIDGWVRDYTEFDARFKKYWLIVWNCTDTWVGTAIYMLDDKPFAVSNQTARKNDEEFTFLSKDEFTRAHTAMMELLTAPDEQHIPIATEEELDGEIGMDYSVEFGSQLVSRTAFLDGELVTVVKEHGNWYIVEKVDVQKADGTIIEKVAVEDLRLPLRVKEES